MRVYQLNRSTPTGAFTSSPSRARAGSDATTNRWLGSVHSTIKGASGARIQRVEHVGDSVHPATLPNWRAIARDRLRRASTKSRRWRRAANQLVRPLGTSSQMSVDLVMTWHAFWFAMLLRDG